MSATARLRTAVGGDFRAQWRFGFVAVGVLVAVTGAAVLRAFATPAWGFAIPAFVIGNVATTTYYFAACLVLFEKGEGTLEAVVVTPLRIREYLGSKVATLTVLASVETLAILAFAYPGPLAAAPLVLGTAATSVALALLGIVAVARYDSVTNFLFPSVGVLLASQLPILDSLGVAKSPVFWLHPARPFLLLLEAALRPLSSVEWAYALGFSAATLGALAWGARRAFDVFIVHRSGSSR